MIFDFLKRNHTNDQPAPAPATEKEIRPPAAPENDDQSNDCPAGCCANEKKEDGPFRIHQVPWIAIR